MNWLRRLWHSACSHVYYWHLRRLFVSGLITSHEVRRRLIAHHFI